LSILETPITFLGQSAVVFPDRRLASGMLEMTMTLATVTGRLEEYERLKALSTSIH